MCSAFPSINSLLNSPPKVPRTWSSQAETPRNLDQQPQSPTDSLMSISTAERPDIQYTAHRNTHAPGSSTTGSPCSISTIIGPNTPGTVQSSLPPPSDISIDDPWIDHRQPDDLSFSNRPWGTFHQDSAGTFTSPHPTYHNPLISPQTVYLDALLRICTASALEFYFSLLPPPIVCISVHQAYPEPHHLPGPLRSPPTTTTEYYPHPTPTITHLYTEALAATRASSTSFSLTHLLTLISHCTYSTQSSQPGHSAWPPVLRDTLQQETQHAARMTSLWDLSRRLLGFRSGCALGLRLGAGDLWAAGRIAAAFCDGLGDAKGWEEVAKVWGRVVGT